MISSTPKSPLSYRFSHDFPMGSPGRRLRTAPHGSAACALARSASVTSCANSPRVCCSSCCSRSALGSSGSSARDSCGGVSKAGENPQFWRKTTRDNPQVSPIFVDFYGFFVVELCVINFRSFGTRNMAKRADSQKQLEKWKRWTEKWRDICHITTN